MTADPNLPAHKPPRVVRGPNGERLFIIEGEPRVVDLDLAKDLGRNGETRIRDLIKRHLPRIEKRGKLLCFNENGELPYGREVPAGMLPILKQEGLIAARGTKPVIAFLNKRQMRWVVMKSETENADDLLDKILDVYDAWENGTLLPKGASPQAVMPPPQAAPTPQAPPTLRIAPPLRERRPDVAHFEGMALAEINGRLHVHEASFADATGLETEQVDALLKQRQIITFGDLPEPWPGGGRYMNKTQVEFLLHKIEATNASLDLVGLLTAHLAGEMTIMSGEVIWTKRPRPVDPAVWHVRLAEEIRRNPSMWASAEFIRDDLRILRVRHSTLARILGRDDDEMRKAIAAYKPVIEGADKIWNRTETEDGAVVLGHYLTLQQGCTLAQNLGHDPDEVAFIFERHTEFEVEISARARMERYGYDTNDSPIAEHVETLAALCDAMPKPDEMRRMAQDLTRLRRVIEGEPWPLARAAVSKSASAIRSLFKREGH